MTLIAPDRSVSGVPAVRHLSAAATTRLLGDWRAGGPVYLALADALRSAVLSGTLAPLTRLPSERDLATTLGVSRTTTAAAYARLRELGFAVSRVGSGTVAVLPRGSAGERLSGRHTAAAVPAGDAPAAERPGQAGWLDLATPIDLGQGTPSATPVLHEAFSRALEALPAYLGTGGYAHHGIDPLRAAIADRYTARGMPTTPDQVIVTTGAQEAIALLAAAFLAPRETIVVESPTYCNGIEAMRRAGARVVGVPVGDVETLVSAIRRTRPRLVYLVPDFHNPTGRSLTADERQTVRDVADRTGVTVIGDETLTDLALDDDATVPEPFAGDGASPHVVSVGSASKVFWGGLRVGWVRGPEQVVQRLARTRQSFDIATAVLEQLAVVELLARRAEVLPARLAALREQRDLLVGGLRSAVCKWDVPSPPGGLGVWVGLGRPVAQAFAAAAVAEGVRVTAGPSFTPDGGARDRVRLTFTRTPEELEDAVGRLARAWRRVAG